MQKKYKLLFIGILLDGIGMLSFAVPFIGETFDVIWAPIASYLIYKLYGGMVGKVAGVISFVEEIGIFGTDLIPTFTCTWIYKYLIKRED